MTQLALRFEPTRSTRPAAPRPEPTPHADLSDEELVAQLVASPAAPDPLRGAQILRACEGLARLPIAEPAGLVREGVDPESATLLLAALEIGRRLAMEEVPRVQPLDKPRAVAAYLALRYLRRTQEVMGALYLDRRQRLIRDHEVFRGCLERAAVEPRPILQQALALGATGIVLFHTHPSGDPAPSLEDLAFTRRMAEAGEAVGVRLVDHLILAGTGRWVSLRERGAW